MPRETTVSSKQESRPGGGIPERLKRKNETCDSSILRRCHRNAPRDRRRLALAEAMGAPPPWHRLGDVVREIA